MTRKEAAQIVIDHVKRRDAEARKEGLDSLAWILRRINDLVGEYMELTAEDVLKGRGAGSESDARRLIRLAKKLQATEASPKNLSQQELEWRRKRLAVVKMKAN